MAHVDVISDILKAALDAFPDSGFLQSLAHQYLTRGWLTKKQLEGLYDKAKKAPGVHPGKLATLDAQIKKMPTRFRSEKPEIKPAPQNDEQAGKWIDSILSKFPEHKRVLFLQAKWKQQSLTTPERAELEKLDKLLAQRYT